MSVRRKLTDNDRLLVTVINPHPHQRATATVAASPSSEVFAALLDWPPDSRPPARNRRTAHEFESGDGSYSRAGYTRRGISSRKNRLGLRAAQRPSGVSSARKNSSLPNERPSESCGSTPDQRDDFSWFGEAAEGVLAEDKFAVDRDVEDAT
jgi:hypothetical protein